MVEMFLKLCLYHEFVEEFMQGKEKVNEKKKGKKDKCSEDAKIIHRLPCRFPVLW